MDDLTELEFKLLSGLTNKYPALKSHIPLLKVTDRKATGNGLFVNFSYLNSVATFDTELNALYSNEERIKLPSLEKGLCFVIDITCGEISYIEFTTYCENWDGNFNGYEIVSSEP